MNEEQFKAAVRQAFSLVDTADRAILDVDQLLGRVMLQVRRLVETLPEEGLLRNQSWTSLRGLVQSELEIYTKALERAIQREQVIASPGMADYAAREARYAGANLTNGLGAPEPPVVAAMVDKTVMGKTRFKQLFATKDGEVTPWTQGMFRVVDRNVRTGILQGLTTEQIAEQVVHETISRGVPGVTLQGKTSVRQIRSQAMAMSRTVSQDVNNQIKEQLYEANAEALSDFVYQHFAALDSRTCQTCAPLSGKRSNDGKTFVDGTPVPHYPIHINCRCQLLLIDPEDEFWNEGKLTGQQLSEKPFSPNSKGTYKTKVKVKGERFYRQAREFTGNDFSDYLAQSNLTTQREFFGGGPIGERRARYFRRELDRMNKDPQQILESMLTGPTNARKFIPLPK